MWVAVRSEAEHDLGWFGDASLRNVDFLRCILSSISILSCSRQNCDNEFKKFFFFLIPMRGGSLHPK